MYKKYLILYKKVCNNCARRRLAIQEPAKQALTSVLIIQSAPNYLAWNIGLAKFQCCIIFRWDLVSIGHLQVF